MLNHEFKYTLRSFNISEASELLLMLIHQLSSPKIEIIKQNHEKINIC